MDELGYTLLMFWGIKFFFLRDNASFSIIHFWVVFTRQNQYYLDTVSCPHGLNRLSDFH